MKEIYDVIVVGGGPAGLTACVYALRSNLKVLLIEKLAIGGQTLNTYEIKNFPSVEDISGFDLSSKMHKQVEKLGVEQVFDEVINFNLQPKIKVLKTFSGKEFYAKTVILSMGAKAKKLGIEGEQTYSGKGVSYCAVCDGAFFKNKTVAIVGGGNSAMEDVQYLYSVCKNVILLNRTEKFRALPSILESALALEKENKIKILRNTVVTKINGSSFVESIDILNVKNNVSSQIKVDGIFIEIGRVAETNYLNDISLDANGFVLANEDLETNIKGVYVAGDIRQKKLKQIITACADGAIAATSAFNFINSINN